MPVFFDVRSNAHDVIASLGRFERESVPFWTAYALNRTAEDIKAAEVETMGAVFDRPTRFTLNALFVKPATKQTQVAAVLFKEGFGSVPAWRYLGPQVEGGPRVKKSHERALERAGILRADEFAVPGAGAKLDAHGNMSGSEIVRILSQVGAGSANMTARSRGRNIRRAGGQYFVLRGKRAPDGIYQRRGMHEIVPVMIFVRQPSYQKRFPFRETARRVFAERFHLRLREAIARYPHRPARRLAA